jgi:Bacterial archaeo-eukaryotic release factor family 10
MIRVQQLQEITALSAPILSAYLNTKAENASRHPQEQSCVAWFRKEPISVSRSLLPRDAEQFERQAERIERFLSQRRPEEKALAIFAGRENWTVLPLQASVENELRWGKPAVGQLYQLMRKHQPSCVVVMDHHAARFFMYSLGELTLLEEKTFDVDISQWKKKDLGHFMGEQTRKTRGSNRDVFEHRLGAQYARLCGEAAERAAALCEQHSLTDIFLVGPDRLSGLIKAKIPQTLAELVFVITEDLGNFSPEDVRRRLEPLMDNYKRRQQIAAVTYLFGADHGAVTNVDETLTQLQNGALRTLVLAENFDLEVHQCLKCGRANRSADPACAACGAPRRKVALCEILPALLTAHDTKLEIVIGDAAQMLARAGGMCGWLRRAKRNAAG